MNISDLITSIKTQIEAVTGYSELKHSIRVEENARIARKNSYTLLVQDSSEVDGVVGYFTLDTQFKISLGNVFISKQTGDANKLEIISTLYDKMLEVYQKLNNTKCGRADICMHVKNLEISEPEVMDNLDMVFIYGTITITHRTKLS